MGHHVTASTCAAVLLFATAAWAQVGDYTGTVTHIDPSTNTVYFSDGRILHLAPGATLTVDGREIRLDDVKPGMSVAVDRRHPGLVTGPQPGAAQDQQAAAQGGARVLTGHPPVDVTGTVARVDAQNRLVMFEDGRTVRLTDQARVWTPMSGRLQAGEQILVRGALPVGFQGAAGTQMPQAMTHRLGTVASVDESRSLIVLTDGTTVQVRPTTRVHYNGEQVGIGELQPGDEIVLIVRQPALSGRAGQPMSPAGQERRQDDSASALPRQEFSRATIDAEDVQVLFRHQAGG